MGQKSSKDSKLNGVEDTGTKTLVEKNTKCLILKYPDSAVNTDAAFLV